MYTYGNVEICTCIFQTVRSQQQAEFLFPPNPQSSKARLQQGVSSVLAAMQMQMQNFTKCVCRGCQGCQYWRTLFKGQLNYKAL